MKRKSPQTNQKSKKVQVVQSNTLLNFFNIEKKSPSPNHSQESTPEKVVIDLESKSQTETIIIEENTQNSLNGESQSSQDSFIFQTPVKQSPEISPSNSQPNSPEEYVPTYYLTNFFTVYNAVLEKDEKLFNETELELLKKFQSYDESAQRLFVRLFHRKRKWFQVSSLNYQEIPHIELTVQLLEKIGFVEFFNQQKHESDIKEILNILKTDILKSFISQGLTKGSKKEDMIEIILKPKQNLFSKNQNDNTLLKKILNKIGSCISITEDTNKLIDRVNMLFFLNNSQNSNSFLLSDLKVIQFPNYEYKPTSIFKSREHLIEYQRSLDLSRNLTEFIQEKSYEKIFELCESVLEQFTKMEKDNEKNYFLLRYTHGYVFASILYESVTFYEQKKNYEKAIEILRKLIESPYLKSSRGKWWNRMALDQEHMKNKKEAFETCKKGLSDKITLGDKLTLERRLDRLYKRNSKDLFKNLIVSEDGFNQIEMKLKSPNIVKIQGISITKGLPGKSKYIGDDNNIYTVEEYVSRYYKKEYGYEAIHSEGSVFMNLFGLFFWDIIYTNIPFVFQSKFQQAPLDFRTAAFYDQRKEKIDKKLFEIQSKINEELLEKVWDENFGIQNACIRWDTYSLGELIKIAKLIGGKVLSCIFERLSKNMKDLKGMPDLILYKDDGMRFCEVKSQRDHLSDHQKIWINILIQNGANVDVCHVLEKL